MPGATDRSGQEHQRGPPEGGPVSVSHLFQEEEEALDGKAEKRVGFEDARLGCKPRSFLLSLVRVMHLANSAATMQTLLCRRPSCIWLPKRPAILPRSDEVPFLIAQMVSFSSLEMVCTPDGLPMLPSSECM